MYTPLNDYIKLLIDLRLNEGKLREAEISNDRKVPWGSKEHISDLEKRIVDIEYWRNKLPKGSEKRSHYRNVLISLKSELKSAYREKEKLLSTKG